MLQFDGGQMQGLLSGLQPCLQGLTLLSPRPDAQ
jgi:hypothetical protein